jgi:hypothetical protein
MRPGERSQRPDFCSTGLPLCPGFAGLRPITFALLLTSCLSSCADRTPPIGRDLGSTDARSDFDRRVQDRFPIGSDEQQLLAELGKEGFQVRDGIAMSLHYPPPARFRSAADYSADQFLCKSSWTILWSADNGRITAIAGDFLPICL